ncbi:PAAR-like domain-containing protein [Polyangium sp. 6x1]|uniref:PAAR-like domain-containing protein n=1 Tax=Polyangium sp. 6x1 TaxID=3042689 RepID=UPI002482AD2A|nr:PAAR-like domain-containing protein [Polyangium sp. 6x1]MDI1451768.1 DUF4150 domain-containing protein [Polyangium sp. 6x1]
MASKHVANREGIYLAINSSPDMCMVGEAVVPFEIYQTLDSEKTAFSTKVFVRRQPVLLAGSIIKGVIGNAGKGVLSGVAVEFGHIKVRDGAPKVFAEKRKLARHMDPVEMNGKA